MLRPAVLYREQIIRNFQERFYTDDMQCLSYGGSNVLPSIDDEPFNSEFQYAVVDDNDPEKLIGFISFHVDWYVSMALDFIALSFDKGNILMGKAMKEVIDMISKEFHLHRMEWFMNGGNPVEKSYDRFCKMYNGNKYVLHDAMKDKSGKYRDRIIYEIIFDKSEEINGTDNNREEI